MITRLSFAATFVGLSVLCSTGAAQPIFDTKAVSEIQAQYLADLDTVKTKIMALATAIPESSYAWRPAAGTRSVSEALMHVASEWYFFAPMVVGAKPPADFGPPREALPKLEKITAKAEVLSQLEKAWTHGKTAIAAVDPTTLTGKYKVFGRETTLPQATFLMSGDLHEHLGQLITYARSVGVKPPWSR